jgi:YbbR domain-containing protein
MDTFTSKTVPVQIVLTNPPPVGYESGSEQATPSTVSVYGPSHELANIEARVAVNLSTQKANFQAQVPVLVYNTKTGIQVTNVGVDHSNVSVSITITGFVTTRFVAVLTKTTGSPSPGHYLTGIVVSPLTVIATGSRDLLNSLDSVSTSAISLNGAFGTYTAQVSLVAPPGVTLSQSKVTVTIEIGNLPSPPTPTPTPTPTTSPSP